MDFSNNIIISSSRRLAMLAKEISDKVVTILRTVFIVIFINTGIINYDKPVMVEY